MKVLIANDEQMQLKVLKLLFQKYQFEVVTASNGFQAFEIVRESMGSINSMFDLIVMDLNMPISDGYQATNNIINLYKT